MHVSAHGYVGLCKINGGEVNICGLFRKRADENWRGQKLGVICCAASPVRLCASGWPARNLMKIPFAPSPGFHCDRSKPAIAHEICVGDAITMIPPVTGNGMSMAFESAELAVAPLAAWSRGRNFMGEARQKIARDCDAAFARRLAWAKWLQRLILDAVVAKSARHARRPQRLVLADGV